MNAALIARVMIMLSLSAASASPAGAAPPSLIGKAAIERAIGNTIVSRSTEQKPDLQEGKLYLRRDGTAAWVSINGGAEPAELQWSIDAKEHLCLTGFPYGDVSDNCTQIQIRGDDVTLFSHGESSHGILIVRLIEGNPFNL